MFTGHFKQGQFFGVTSSKVSNKRSPKTRSVIMVHLNKVSVRVRKVKVIFKGHLGQYQYSEKDHIKKG